ncbi:pRiA4b ORF-3-like protein [Mucilaginibacter yixingensis]|uniref:PRiA4b ORF-3-like protein n=1 Tax=Mucilaginibacter yixingensis TaxID=1295612 RepID=A0A2T5JCC2_9SPHI|nr:hypothetical protein [Mucilaginibacter yixingensis]PTQ99315.1 pRiA4b ORF-3-like protein [Mucilaginibacter yixingensis]
MAIYKFRVTFEDYDDVVREIDIKSNQTFLDLHKIIQQSTGYNAELPSSFYVSNDQWTKGEEITYLPNQKRIDRGIALMEKVKLSSFIDDPHQKFYYTYNFDRPYDFHVELIKILDDAPGVTYPIIAKSTGEAPRQLTAASFNPTTAPADNEDFDFLNEMEYAPEDAEDFDELRDDSESASSGSSDEEEEEDNDDMDEFSDNENYDDEDHGGGRGRHDDY